MFDSQKNRQDRPQGLNKKKMNIQKNIKTCYVRFSRISLRQATGVEKIHSRI